LNQLAIGRRRGLRGSLVALLLTRGLAAEPQPGVVILTVDAESEAQKQAASAVQAHISDLPVQIQVVPLEHRRSLDLRLAAAGSLAASRGALGTFYLELAEDGAVLVFLTEPNAEATLVRRLPPSRQGVRLGLEQAAIVVRSLVEALLDGGSIGIAAPPGRGTEARRAVEPSGGADASRATEPSRAAERTAPPDSVAPSTEPNPSREEGSPTVAVTAGYTAADFSAASPWHSGFSSGLQWLATPEWYAGARYTFFPRLKVENDDAAVSIGRHPLEGLIGYHASRRFGLNGEFGLLVDRTTRTTVRAPAELEPTSASARWTFALAVRGGLSWSPWSRVRASFRVGADLLLTRYAYTIDSAAAIPAPNTIRPRLELDVALGLW
jgi:hypothetical protein